METIFVILIEILGYIWKIVSEHAGAIVIFIFGYIALKDIDRLRDRVVNLNYDVGKIKERLNMEKRDE